MISVSVEKAAERLRKAVPIMVKHGIPVTPVNYALWYTYVSNDDPTLNRRIDDIVATYGTVPFSRAADLFHEHVSPNGEHDAAIARVKEDLEKMVQGIGQELNATLSGTQEFTTLLDECSRDLRSPQSTGNSFEDVFGTVEKLLQGSTAMHESSARFEQKLKSANAEIRRLRDEMEALRRNAMHDELTGVNNRRAFDTELAQLTPQAARGVPLHLAMLDIDHFKQFNDRFGHQVGDRVLSLVGKQLNDTGKLGVSAYRYGGEEFALVFCGGSADQAVNLCENLRMSVERLALKDNRSGERLAQISVSIGLATFRSGESTEEFVARADHALYKAKQRGRNRLHRAE